MWLIAIYEDPTCASNYIELAKPISDDEMVTLIDGACLEKKKLLLRALVYCPSDPELYDQLAFSLHPKETVTVHGVERDADSLRTLTEIY